MIEPLITPGCKCHFDTETQLVRIVYHDNLTASTTSAAYAWIMQSIEKLIEKNMWVRGGIFDFSAVKTFALNNLSTIQRESKSLRTTNAERIEQVPVALLVQSAYQEAMVSTSMKVTQQSTPANSVPRVRLVYSLDEAHAHIDAWHTARHSASSGA